MTQFQESPVHHLLEWLSVSPLGDPLKKLLVTTWLYERLEDLAWDGDDKDGLGDPREQDVPELPDPL